MIKTLSKTHFYKKQNINTAQKMNSPLLHFDLLPLVLVFFMSFSFLLQLSVESDSLIPGERLTWNRTLTSKGGVFEMGFFAPPGNSYNYYIGIWYKGLPQAEKTVVWVANRDSPVSDPHSSWLEIDEFGYLALLTSSGLEVWSTGPSFNSYTPLPTNSSVGTLGDDGNFVVRSGPFGTIWESFYNPTDTWLPGAKFGYDKDTSTPTILTSWNDTENPATGLFSARVEDDNSILSHLPEIHILVMNGSVVSKIKLCLNDLDIGAIYGCSLNWYGYERTTTTYYPYSSYIGIAYSSNPRFCLVRYTLDVTGQLKLLAWSNGTKQWELIKTKQQPCHSSSGKTSQESGNKNDTREKGEEMGKTSVTNWIVIVALILLALLFIGITVLLSVSWRKDSDSSSEATGADTLKIYKHRDLRRATKNFTEKLGKGGFSTVYKGELPGSTVIAVKELQGQLQEEKQLRAELNTVGLIQHKNLARLRGFCLQHSKKFLVYDYMQNGSLESHLFQKGTNILDWGTRRNIALGAAKGLAYLHEECRDCIIHCDIKPENILLDAEFNPKVADFGLAKLLGRNFSRVLTTMRGTRGYLAPEWFSGEPVTAKVDVFSYGQVLFEIISGRRNMDLLNDELKSYFPALVLNALNNGADVLPLADSKLEGELNVEELTRACKVAGWCIQDHEKDRPTMTQAVQILEGVLDVAIPPMPQFFQSIAEASLKEIVIKEREAYSTSSTLSTSFTFQPSAQSIQHEP